MEEVAAQAIGLKAGEFLERAHSGSVWGATSHGLFLQLELPGLNPPCRIIFLSGEPYRGPLSLNLGGASRRMINIQPGAMAKIEPGQRLILAGELAVSWAGSELWLAPDIRGELLPAEQRLLKLVQLIHALLERKGFSGSFDDLPLNSGTFRLLIELAGYLPIASDALNPFSLLHETGLWAVCHGQAIQLQQQLQPIIGLGGGLTPSGDDLIAGLLAGLNRWAGRIGIRLDMQALNRAVVQSAFQKTSLLSASMIEAASQGELDERLLWSLDGLFNHQPSVHECAEYLANWGRNSGLDALCGMALLVSAVQNI